jgi:hypothetical protein
MANLFTHCWLLITFTTDIQQGFRVSSQLYAQVLKAANE